MPGASLVSAKTVIRCRDFDRSRHFYAVILRLPIVAEWTEHEGRGCIYRVGDGPGAGMLESYEMKEADPRFDPVFRELLPSDKIDVQLRTGSVDEWAKALADLWPFTGPDLLPWGQRWIKLRDPDGLLIAIYEEASQGPSRPRDVE